MGMYTHLVLNVNFKHDTPEEVIDTIKYMVGDTETPPPEQNHKLFGTSRWVYCLRCDSWYFMGCTNTTFEKEMDTWQLTVNSNCKNYTDEYRSFLDYIQPYVQYREFLGFIRYEEDEHPTLIYNTTEGIEYVTPSVELKGKAY